MSNLPDILKSGEIARLIPVVPDNRREQKATSVFLATLCAVPSFAEELLASVNQRVGARTAISSYTEVVFREQPGQMKKRPDGLLVVDRGRKSWSALVEAKIGTSVLDPTQIEEYVQLARSNRIDAIITISNEFVARADHSPIHLPKSALRRTDLFHWSWKFILTEALLLQSRAAIRDPDQAFLLREFIRFLSHGSVGVTGFNQMPSGWKYVATQIRNGASLSRSSAEVESVVRAWHQEIGDLCLRLSHHLAEPVASKLTRSHVTDSDLRLKDDCIQLAEHHSLTAVLEVPGAASDINVKADLGTKTIRLGMVLGAPQDRQRGTARLNWLLRQLRDVDAEGLFVRVIWPSRARDFVCSLTELYASMPQEIEKAPQAPRAFEVFYVSDDARRFTGRKTFIEELEKATPSFYDRVGQRLQTWRRKPPKPATEINADTGGQAKVTSQEAAQVQSREKIEKKGVIWGNKHTDLLEVPSFVKWLPE